MIVKVLETLTLKKEIQEHLAVSGYSVLIELIFYIEGGPMSPNHRLSLRTDDVLLSML